MPKQYASQKKNLLCNLLHLRSELLYEEIENPGFSNKEVQALVDSKIKSLEQEKVDAAIYRSRSKWHNEGEKMSKYFFSLENEILLIKHNFLFLKKQGNFAVSKKGS